MSKEEAEAAEMAPKEEPEGTPTEDDLTVEDVETASASELEQEGQNWDRNPSKL